MTSRALAGLVLLLSAAAARADVTISDHATKNISCSAGACSPTTENAVLNVGELAGMLASGDTTVMTGGVTKDIEINAPFSWSSTSRLTLDAQRSVIVKKQVTVAGRGALTVTTNDGGQNGELVIVSERGSVQLWDLSSSLIIDGHSYTLVGDIKTLAADIAADSKGHYALANNYDASVDGTYTSPPVPTRFDGVFEGLGNRISNLSMKFPQTGLPAGFFAFVLHGTVRDLGLTKVSIQGTPDFNIGPLAGTSAGRIIRAWTAGLMSLADFSEGAGGLIGANVGELRDCHANMRITLYSGGLEHVGGLVGYNPSTGKIDRSYSYGLITVTKGSLVEVGGIVGLNEGLIVDSFSFSRVIQGTRDDNTLVGGLVGENNSTGMIVNTYSAGITRRHDHTTAGLGGLVGRDNAPAGNITTSYWNLDAGISDPSQGAGNIKNDPGITGLTTPEFLSGLPQGFSPKIWGSNPNINNGYPYLLANPPQ